MKFKDMTREEQKEWLKAQREDFRRKQEENEAMMWKTLRPFDEDGAFIPELPRDLQQYHINKLLKCGAIPKDDLQDGIWYYGDNRNAKYGLWDAENKYFKIRRYKFGKFYWDTTYHFQDDDGFALFVPIRKATEEEVLEVENPT